MTKYKANEIDQPFMKMHKLCRYISLFVVEETS